MKNPIAFVVILIIIQSCIKPSSNNPQPPLNPGNSNLTITALKPTNGYVPLTDTIIGTGFSTKINEDSVYYNGLKVTVLSATSTQLVVSLPSQTVTGQVLVKVNGSIAGGPTFTVFSVPSITAISPAHGVATMVDTIFGNNFSATLSQNSVFFNGVQANILAVSSNQLIVTIPQSTTGKVTVTSGGVNVTGPIFTYDNDSVVVSTLAGSNAQTEIDGPALSAAFTQVWDVSSDSLGNVYVADGGGNNCRRG